LDEGERRIKNHWNYVKNAPYIGKSSGTKKTLDHLVTAEGIALSYACNIANTMHVVWISQGKC